MHLEDFAAVLRRVWLAALLAFLVGLLGAWFVVKSAPAVYRSTAATVVSANAAATDPSALNSVTASIAMTMPGYVAQATSTETVKAAANATKLDTDRVGRALKASRDVDSTVINWTFDAPTASAARDGLAAATDTFKRQVLSTAGEGKNGQPVIQVVVAHPAEEGKLVGTQPLTYGLLAGLGLALLTYLLGLLWHLRTQSGEASARRVEEELRIPVVSVVREPAERSAAWASAAQFIGRRATGDTVALVSPGEEPSEAADGLAAALHESGLPTARVIPVAAWEADTARLLAATDAMVLVLDPAQERRVGRVAAEFRSLTLAGRGPSCVVLDRSPVPARA